MKSVSIYVLFAGILAVVKCNQYIMENPTIGYYNPKYIKDAVYTITKNDDGYTIHSHCDTLIEFDDKMSLTLALSKKVGNHFEPTQMTATYKLCQFFEDPWGKLLLQQLPSVKCPVPAQKHSYTFKSVPLEHIPHANKLDSSWKTRRMRIDVSVSETASKELILNCTTEVQLI